ASMEIVKVRPRGQITIPKRLREELQIEQSSVLDAFRVGDAIVLSPRRSRVVEIAQQMAHEFAEAGITLEELLEELDRQRRRYVKEEYGLQTD
ncbi:MAG: AbrB/MazE/SpoVT family DNA-binding domain-containing protein, partial [Armatimonadota bacterium]